MPVKHWTINSLDDQIELGKQFVQEYVDKDSKPTRERYVLGKYLRDWFRPTEYPFQIEDRIESSKSPDCILQLKNRKRIGLELTEATLQRFRAEQATKVGNNPNVDIIYESDPETGEINVLSRYKSDDQGNSQLIEQNNWMDQPPYGKSPNSRVANLVVQSVHKKSNKVHIWRSIVDIAYLCIVINPPVREFDSHPICGMVARILDESDEEVSFDSVFLIHPSEVVRFDDYIEVVNGHYLLVRLNP